PSYHSLPRFLALLLQDFFKLVECFKFTVNACEPYISHFVTLGQLIHHKVTDLPRSDLSVVDVIHCILDTANNLFDLHLGLEKLTNRPMDRGTELAAIKQFALAVFFYNNKI